MSASEFRSAWQLPLQWPHGDVTNAARHSARAEHLLKSAIVFAMLALTVLDRFGLRVTDEYSLPPGLMAMYALGAAMAFTGAAQFNPGGLLAYLAVVAVASLSFMVNTAYSPPMYLSTTSFLLLVVLYAPFVLSLRDEAVSPALWRWTVNLYIAFALFLALAGIAQFLVQFVFRPAWLFDFTALIPEPIRASGGWNTVYSTGEWVKSNGFFLREPSIFSIAMAFALLCELSLARRKWVMALLALGLVLTYSGSGLLCLAVALLFPLGWGTLWRVLGGAALVAATYFVLGDALNLSYTLERAQEFTSERSSAYCRFIYPGVATLQQVDASGWAAVLGHGPGTMERMGATCADGHQTTYAKALFEYGLAGAAAFGILVLGALNRSSAPLRIRVGVGVTWVLLGGNLLASEVLLFIYLLSGMWPADAAARTLHRQGAA